MMNCPAGKLQAMPYAMADSAMDAPFYLSETHTARAKDQLLPCAGYNGGGRSSQSAAAGAIGNGSTATGDGVLNADLGAAGEGEGEWLPLYCDHPFAKVRLPEEARPAGVARVHLLTANADAEVEESFHKDVMQSITGGTDTPFLSFVPSKDCRYVCLHTY